MEEDLIRQDNKKVGLVVLSSIFLIVFSLLLLFSIYLEAGVIINLRSEEAEKVFGGLIITLFAIPFLFIFDGLEFIHFIVFLSLFIKRIKQFKEHKRYRVMLILEIILFVIYIANNAVFFIMLQNN